MNHFHLLSLIRNIRIPACLSVLLLSGCSETRHTTSLKASVDFANTVENGDSEIKYDSKTGVNVIVYQEFESDGSFMMDREADTTRFRMSAPHFGLGIGLEYIGKGAKLKEGNTTLGLNYIEIPIHVLYYYPAGPGSFHAGLGPYFAYGIGGQIKGDGFTEKSFGEDDGGYKRFDAGIGLMLGYRVSTGASIDLSYDFGLTNNAYTSLDVKSHNRCFSINLGYEFGHLLAK